MKVGTVMRYSAKEPNRHITRALWSLLTCCFVLLLMCCSTKPTLEPQHEQHEEQVQDASTQETPKKEETNTKDTKIFPKEGGRVCGDSICVDAPKSALPSDKDAHIHFHPVTSSLSGNIAPVIEVGPDDWKPSADVEIVFKHADIALPNGKTYDDVQVAFIDNGLWKTVPTTNDNVKKEVRGKTNHFSSWSVVIQGGACGSDQDCGPNQLCSKQACYSVLTCTSNADCSFGQTCSMNRRLCTAPSCVVTTEICDRIDNDCDGQVDEGCAPCTTDADCNPAQACVNGTCQ